MARGDDAEYFTIETARLFAVSPGAIGCAPAAPCGFCAATSESGRHIATS